MAKPLAGRRLFEARGRSANSHGIAINARRQSQRKWPVWAQLAWVHGWLAQNSTFKKEKP